VTFRNVLALENFVVLLVVIFGLQFIDRSFGPVLPLYVAELGTPRSRVPLVAGLLFSIAAGAGALGHHLCSGLLRRTTARMLIAASAGAAASSTLLYTVAGGTALLFASTPVFGVAIGAATTASYAAAGSVIPPAARGAGFGLLTTASLTGLALSPIVAGILGTMSIRAVFVLDTVGMLALAGMVSRLMIAGPLGRAETPVAEEV
jgi:DHA1 family tetracycline resistance protein-like MFS transporter